MFAFVNVVGFGLWLETNFDNNLVVFIDNSDMLGVY